MSKTKELAREIEDKYSRSKIWDMNIDSDISDIVYLAIDLSRKILSEPEPLRGWIEVTGRDNTKKLINLALIERVDVDRSGVYLEFNRDDCVVLVQESYDEIKQEIARAG